MTLHDHQSSRPTVAFGYDRPQMMHGAQNPYQWGPPPAGMYPEYPIAKSGPSAGRILAIVALGIVGLFVVLVVIGVAVNAIAPTEPSPAGRPPTTGTTQTSNPPDTGTAAPVADAGLLPQAFPDVTTKGSECTPLDPARQPYLTSANVRPVAIEQCNYSNAAPGAQILYFQWPSAPDAAQWFADSSTYPRVEPYDVWTADKQPQGPNHIQRDPRDGTYEQVTAYTGKPFSFTIYGPTQQAVDVTADNVRVLDSSRLPG